MNQMIPSRPAARVAVLVDGDNIGPKRAAEIHARSEKFGQPAIMRAYGNSKVSWVKAEKHGYRFVYAGNKENASDILISIQAMDFALSGRADVIVIASSDNDFRHLAHALREKGFTVVGLGESKAPAAFVNACSFFEFLDDQRSTSDTRATKTDRRIKALIEELGLPEQGIEITKLSSLMRSRYNFQISSQDEKKWRSYLTRRSTLYDVDPKGKQARVRLVTP